MLKILTAALLATAAATTASAAMIDLQGGASVALPSATGSGANFYDPQGLAGNPDPWDGGTTVLTGVDAILGPDAREVAITYRGNESGFDNELRLDGNVLFTSNSSASGSTVLLSAAEFGRLSFFSNGGGNGYALTSEQVAVTAAANVLQVGFNDAWGGDADFDDLRFEAVVTPVPAALPLMASGIAGLAWWRRRQRRAA